MNLFSLGWDDFFSNHFSAFSRNGLVPARVAAEHKHGCQLLSTAGVLSAKCTGKLLHIAATRADLPAVGDWVVVRPRAGEMHADIHAVLPRRTKFSRRAAGEGAVEQIVATNVDTVLLVTALDQNYNLRRIERYLAAARESGAQPVVVLNKSDLCTQPAQARAEVEAIAADAPVVLLSATRNDGLDALIPWLVPGRTLALLGSSGVGKSTLINRLVGADRQLTGAISDAAGKGRHTTTQRELIIAPSGVLIVDTPGMRELQFWDVAASAVDATFSDVAAIAAECRFRDCNHRAEPGCAIQAALDTGTLNPARWQSYQKLQREQAYAARQADPQLARKTKAQWKKLNQAMRDHHRHEEEP